MKLTLSVFPESCNFFSRIENTGNNIIGYVKNKLNCFQCVGLLI